MLKHRLVYLTERPLAVLLFGVRIYSKMYYWTIKNLDRAIQPTKIATNDSNIYLTLSIVSNMTFMSLY